MNVCNASWYLGRSIFHSTTSHHDGDDEDDDDEDDDDDDDNDDNYVDGDVRGEGDDVTTMIMPIL